MLGAVITFVVIAIIAVILSTIGAAVVMLGTKLIGKFKITYSMAYGTVFSAYIIFSLLRVIVSFFVCRISILFTLPGLFVVHAITYFRRIHGREDGQVLSPLQSCIVAAIQCVTVGLVFLWFIGPDIRPVDVPQLPSGGG